MTVGEKIYYCRLENHMTQKELGEKTGIDSATIGKYERGVLKPKLDTIAKIARAMNLYAADLIDDDQWKQVSMWASGSLQDELAERTKDAQIAIEETRKLSLKVDLMQVEQTFGAGGRKLMELYNLLNDNGQSVAVERVEELAQIPKYQRKPAGDAAPDVPDAEPNTDPTQK